MNYYDYLDRIAGKFRCPSLKGCGSAHGCLLHGFKTRAWYCPTVLGV